jgi:hypothetical protein
MKCCDFKCAFFISFKSAERIKNSSKSGMLFELLILAGLPTEVYYSSSIYCSETSTGTSGSFISSN